MKQRTLMLSVIFLTAISAFAQKTIRRNVYFETNQSLISSESQNYLQALSDSIKRYPSYLIELKGHTDADGSNIFNQTLSEKRVKSVKTTLESNGILATHISIAALGETVPIVDNNTEEGKQRNRRVELLITIYPPNSQSVTSTVSKPYENILQLYKDLGQTPQNFKINTARDTTIKGAKGTSIFIPKEAFQGTPSNVIVDFRLKEAYSFADIIAENLTTHSGDKLLQTGGMFYADAVFNNQSLSLKKDLQVSFPTKESKMEGMQLFTGERDLQRNGRIDWKPIINPTTPNQFVDDTTTLYVDGEGFDPFILTDKNGHMTFKDVLDSSKISPLFVEEKKEGKSYLAVNNDLNKCGTAMAYYAQINAKFENIPFKQLHKIVFKDLYDYYEVNTFEELKKKDGISWDSLINVRMDFIKKGQVPEERWTSRRENLKKAAKLEKLNQIEYEKRKAQLEKEIEEERNNIQLRGQNNLFRDNYNPVLNSSVFPMPKLGWTNIDRYYQQYANNNSFVDVDTNVPQSVKNCNVFLILKAEKAAWYNEGGSISKNFNFQQVPNNKAAFIVGMKTENGKSYLAIQSLKTSRVKVNLDFQQLSPEEIKQQLKTLDN